MRWFLAIVTFLLLLSWTIRWTEIEPRHSIQSASVSYLEDRWTGQTWASYVAPMGWEPIDVPLVNSSTRFNTNKEIVAEIEKRGKSGQLVEAWRKRDLATYIWITLTVLCFIGSIIGFWWNKKGVKNIGLLLPLTGIDCEGVAITAALPLLCST